MAFVSPFGSTPFVGDVNPASTSLPQNQKSKSNPVATPAPVETTAPFSSSSSISGPEELNSIVKGVMFTNSNTNNNPNQKVGETNGPGGSSKVSSVATQNGVVTTTVNQQTGDVYQSVSGGPTNFVGNVNTGSFSFQSGSSKVSSATTPNGVVTTTIPKTGSAASFNNGGSFVSGLASSTPFTQIKSINTNNGDITLSDGTILTQK